jgi:hypothetical protein
MVLIILPKNFALMILKISGVPHWIRSDRLNKGGKGQALGA